MDARKESEPSALKNRTTVQRKSDREVVVTRTFDCPARLVFEAWTRPELFKKWWVPKSMGMTLRSCELDVRVGGGYRLVFGDDPANPMAFFGKYLEVTPYSRLVWTNEEGGDGGPVTTVTLARIALAESASVRMSFTSVSISISTSTTACGIAAFGSSIQLK